MAETVTDRLRAALERDPNLPSLPEHLRELLRLVSDESVAIPVLAREVSKDPAITLKVLRLANSAIYGQSREVTSLERAFSVIGTSEVPAIVAGMASLESCERFVGDPRFRWKDFWAHCTGSAYIATSLGRRLGVVRLESAFLAGLLHDVGYLALSKLDGPAFSEAVQEAVRKRGFFRRVLQERFGIGPDEAGTILAEHSHLPAELHHVIRFIHEPASAPAEARQLVHLVSLSNELAHLIGLTFFRGTADTEVVLDGLPAWRGLAEDFPDLANWDVARLVLDLDREIEASESFVRASRGS